MIYVEQLGGMGNHMFSYSFARSIQLKYGIKDKIAFDYTNYELDEKWKENILGYKCADNIIWKNRELNIIQRLALKLYYKKLSKADIKDEMDRINFECKYRDILNKLGIYMCYNGYYDFKYKPMFKNILCLGFFESPKLFENIDNILRDDFMPNTALSKYEEELLKDIKLSNSVCLGIRHKIDKNSMTDETVRKWFVCGEVYFTNAVKLIDEKIENPKFFISTDDKEWAIDWLKKNTNNAEVVVMDNEKMSTANRLYMMSMCKNFIISNSTFDWWAQHLSDNKDKIVVAPDRWRNVDNEAHLDIMEPNWIRVAGD